MLSVSDFLIPIDAYHEELKNMQWLQRKKMAAIKICIPSNIDTFCHSTKHSYFLNHVMIDIKPQQAAFH